MKISMFLRRGGLFILAAVLLSIGVSSRASAQVLDAKTLAQRVNRHYNSLRSLKVDFTENYQGMGMNRTESGTLYLLKPGRMKWDYSSPAGKLFLVDGKYAWFYSRGAPQVQRISAKQLDDLRSPLRFLLGHSEIEKEFDHLTAASAPNGLFTLTGQPRGQENRIARVTLTVTASGSITGIEVEENDGAVTRFTFTDEVQNAPIAPRTFHFTPPPGIPVVNTMPPV